MCRFANGNEKNDPTEKKGYGPQCTCCRCYKNKLTSNSAKLKSNSFAIDEDYENLESGKVNDKEKPKSKNKSSILKGDEKKSKSQKFKEEDVRGIKSEEKKDIKSTKREEKKNIKSRKSEENQSVESTKSEEKKNVKSTKSEEKKNIKSTKSEEKKNVKSTKREEKKDASKEGHSFFSKIIDIMRCKKESPEEEKENKKEKTSKKDKTGKKDKKRQRKNKRKGTCDPCCTGIDRTFKENNKPTEKKQSAKK